ncbi:MAG: sigma 54-interacting transcriptional regulator [Planctomycetota bacterium]
MLSPDGASDAYVAFLRRIDRLAASSATVLLQGESGAGKGAAARRLHSGGPRRAGPFVIADLAAVAPLLLESTLFGHEKGAFTDAHHGREGLFRRATGGTIVLDDVDLLAPALQGKLLRTLQERVVEPLGAASPVPVDARVVATTRRDLAADAAAGRFRSDLYWRLAVVVVEVPPLRAWIADLPALALHLLPRLAERAGLPPRSLAPAALERLRAHPWPGNVRELENALERALVEGAGAARPLEAADFAFLAEATRGVEEELAARALAHGLTVDAMGRAMMERALVEQRGNVSAAARQVGLTRRAFDYRRDRPAGAAGAGDGEELPGAGDRP